MIISFFSNYLTHHQIPFSEAMLQQPDVEYYFVSTQPMDQERKEGGWSLSQHYQYEIKAYEDNQQAAKAMELALCSDVMIIGSAPEKYIRHRMKNAPRKLTFRYSERVYKNGRWRVLSPRGVLLRLDTYFRYFGKPLYMLCASAYAAGDMAMLGSYLGRCYKWGYFPKTKAYENIDDLFNRKVPHSILWVARLIDWKHPEVPIRIARMLKKDGYDFRLNIIGSGPLEQQLLDNISKYDLEEHVRFLGTMSPECVRFHMEESSLFLFTSDQHEGWGAVLNEAMNSGCATIADDRIGSVPFLIEPGKNGLIYHKGNVQELFGHVKKMLDHPQTACELGKAAYRTITEVWSPEQAAHCFLKICTQLLSGEKRFFTNGPCSKAHISLKKTERFHEDSIYF